MSTLKPWIAGLSELLKHGEDHLLAGSDFDKRMALVTFDNVVELSITNFLGLHPTQRGGREYKREEVEKWLSNYNTKLDFLADFIKKENIGEQVPKDEILFFHRVRNELYHSGIGFVPDMRCLEGSKQAAVWVYSVLFGAGVSSLLKPTVVLPEQNPKSTRVLLSTLGTFLQEVNRLESSIMGALILMGIINPKVRKLTIEDAVPVFTRYGGDLPEFVYETIQKVMVIRSSVLKGGVSQISHNAPFELSKDIENVRGFFDSYVISFDVLPKLKTMYPNWIREDLVSVIIKMKPHGLALELTRVENQDSTTNEETDLGMLLGYSNNHNPAWVASDYAKTFLKVFDPYKISEYTTLFKPGARKAIKAEFGPKNSE